MADRRFSIRNRNTAGSSSSRSHRLSRDESLRLGVPEHELFPNRSQARQSMPQSIAFWLRHLELVWPSLESHDHTESNQCMVIVQRASQPRHRRPLVLAPTRAISSVRQALEHAQIDPFDNVAVRHGQTKSVCVRAHATSQPKQPPQIMMQLHPSATLVRDLATSTCLIPIPTTIGKRSHPFGPRFASRCLFKRPRLGPTR